MSVRIDKKTESEVWEEIKKGELSYTQISKKYGISKTTVTNVRIRQTQNYKNTRRLSLKNEKISFRIFGIISFVELKLLKNIISLTILHHTM